MKLRARFSKVGKVRFTSHRDVARMWERALRRAELRVAYSEGFSPRPKLAFGLALPTGGESMAEYVDVSLDGDIDTAGLCARLTAALPEGLEVQALEVLDGPIASLQDAVVACSWTITVVGIDSIPAEAAVSDALAADEIWVIRSRKGTESNDEVRAAIETLEVGPSSGPPGIALVTTLATKPRGLRPSELVGALFGEVADHRVLRTHQWICCGDGRAELLALVPSPDPPRQAVRA